MPLLVLPEQALQAPASRDCGISAENEGGLTLPLLRAKWRENALQRPLVGALDDGSTLVLAWVGRVRLGLKEGCPG